MGGRKYRGLTHENSLDIIKRVNSNGTIWAKGKSLQRVV
jgi:hypothetical protein